MISRVSSFMLRPSHTARLTRSRPLCIPAVASRTPPRATNARMSIQDTRTWCLTVVSIGLFGTVLLSLLTFIFFILSDMLDLEERKLHAASSTPPFLERYGYRRL